MRELLILAAIGVGTYAMRAVFLVRASTDPPARLARLLPHVGPAVLAAITLPALLAPHGEMSWAGTVPSVLAALAAWALWRRTAKLPIALFGGLGVWWVGTWVTTML
ncbi:AzlD domain-containing protein [Actinomycetospora endophytica]|uniref:AzlD domain-containing protein n=1 Tax=Actinomycetospora endophytica TaxID=2291215 RepID=A0ABS8PAU0_9PSEU|nr:AzlD domain-containing protein [Actinomycetospora endophytica]MCD2195377.1 AzlD domain-containing protein [Actinomycetospora endophytica]